MIFSGVVYPISTYFSFNPLATYVTLFPHQISGPLVRHNTIVPELESPSTYRFSLSHFLEGLQFFILGLSKKVLLADLISLGVTPLANNISVASNTEAILAMVGYSMQLYFDFSGYSDMAIGLGLMLNIHFPQNFNSPYKSRSITEFWQRWHMTLSSWLKDYLYISLGGNKKGRLKTYRNLFLTMVIGGLWHGSNWTFAFWGLFHGTILAIEKILKDHSPYGLRLPWGSRRIEFLKIIWTFFLVNLGWIFFRASDFNSALIWLKKVFFIINEQTYSLALIPERHKDRFFIALGISLLIVFFGRNSWAIKKDLTWKRALILGFLVALTLMYMGDESPFLYFQF
jgi:alginate O-acetyltransferase complex protein AlgI